MNLIDGEIGMMHPQLDDIYGEYIQDAQIEQTEDNQNDPHEILETIMETNQEYLSAIDALSGDQQQFNNDSIETVKGMDHA